MPTFRFNKLVRDKMPELYAAMNERIVSKKLTGKELLAALKDKMVEEAGEMPVESDERQALINELADVEQVMDDFKQVLGITDDEIGQAKQVKLQKKGGFSEGIFVETITLENEDEWVAYYRGEPEKYLELKLQEDGEVDPVLPSIEMGTYRHSKSGRLYDVVGVTFHTETNEPLVLYKPKYESKYEIFARPYAMFVEDVVTAGVKKPRFEKIDD